MKHRKLINDAWVYNANLRAEEGYQPRSKASPAVRVGVGIILLLTALMLILVTTNAWGQSSGKITGVVKDSTEAVIPGTAITVTNTVTGIKQSATANDAGIYNFPFLSIGTYTIEAEAPGFKEQKQEGIKIDVNTSLTIDFTLHVPEAAQTVTVSAGAVRVEATDTQLGQTIGSKQMTDIPLNGRSYTDLLAVQAGVTPITTSGAGNTSSGGGFGTVPVAGEQNTGQFSIHGQRESDNAYYLNGASVQETIGQQARHHP